MTLVDSALIDQFFNSGFEEDVEITTQSGVINLQCHFYDKYQVAKMYEQEIESSLPMIECKKYETENVAQNDIVYVRGVTYQVSEVRPDGEGFMFLSLTMADT